MPEGFLNGIRDLRSSLLAGAILVCSIYVLTMGNNSTEVALSPSAQHILSFHESIPLVLATIFIYIVGSLYITGLEGIVDKLHHNLLLVQRTGKEGLVARTFLTALAPLSNVSRNRLVQEAERFYDATLVKDRQILERMSKAKFVNQVLADVLWMEGKLTGTSLGTTFSDYRGEGEFRLGIGLLLPLGAIATVMSTQLSTLWLLLVVSLTVVVSILTCNYGLYYFRCAHSLLAHHVADGTLLTPTMETLKRTTHGFDNEPMN